VQDCRPAGGAYRKFHPGINVGVIRPVKSASPERRVRRSSQNEIWRLRKIALVGHYGLLLN